MEKIAVIGFGTMGAGITQVFAEAGFTVTAMDISEEILRRGMDTIENGPYGLKKAIAKSKITEEQAKEILSRIKVTTDLTKAVENADFIIEAVLENIDLKKKIFSEVDSFSPKHAIIVSNTSTLSITTLSMATKRPEKVAGMHFFNPPQVMKLVEVIRGLRTADETIEKVKEMAIKLGKTPIICKDIPGFIVNRVLMPAILEGIRLYEQGIPAKDIDTAIKLGLNWPMGPLELSDLIGLDIVLNVVETLYREAGSDAFMPPLILRQMVASGFLGRKTKKGFYEY
ncbi:MAG: 3-hydroxyacyl-CoA dehydrogenase NAD-binding domain-containing protein [Candidatus Bathyarchaeia archaeon]